MIRYGSKDEDGWALFLDTVMIAVMEHWDLWICVCVCE